MEEQTQPKRRRWPIVLGCLLVFIVAMASGLRAANRSEYDFLKDYAPFRVVHPGPLPDEPPGLPDYRCEVLYFDKAAGPKVLAAMRRELTKEKGFQVIESGSQISNDVSFMKGKLSTMGAAYTDDPAMLNFLWDTVPKMRPGEGVVVIIRAPTWFEEKWADLRKFLHLN